MYPSLRICIMHRISGIISSYRGLYCYMHNVLHHCSTCNYILLLSTLYEALSLTRLCTMNSYLAFDHGGASIGGAWITHGAQSSAIGPVRLDPRILSYLRARHNGWVYMGMGMDINDVAPVPLHSRHMGPRSQ